MITTTSIVIVIVIVATIQVLPCCYYSRLTLLVARCSLSLPYFRA